jgi:cytochrome c-type biogenesis protein CcmH
MRLFVLPASTALAVLIAAGGFAWLAARDDTRDATSPAQSFARPSAPDPQPADRLDEHPVDAAAWQSLGRRYAAQGRHGLAVVAFRNAAQLRPDDATLLTEYAFSAAVISQRSGTDEPQRLIERALQLDPTSPQALALAGTLALDRGDYDAATQQWERLAQLAPPDSAREREIHASIAQTRRLANAQAGRIELARAR